MKHFTCWNQLLAMMFGQLSYRAVSYTHLEIKKTEEKIIDKADKLKVAESKLYDAEQRKAELEAKAR